MKHIVCGLLAMLLVSPMASAMNIVASIKPLQLIALEITEGVTTPELLISSTASPHDYALKPSDVKKVMQADLVIWFGAELESFLPKVMAKQNNSLALSDADNITFHYYSDQGEGHSSHGHDSHDGHDHGDEGRDPHIWLGPKQAKQSAKVIAEKLVQLDPDNAALYQANLSSFIASVDNKVLDIEHRVSPYQSVGFFVFHDGYGYFEKQFGLNKVGYFTLSPERKPGAKTLIQIQSELKSGHASCVFTEPQFKPSIVKSVTRGTDVAVGELDPLATDIDAVSGGYVLFLDTLSQQYIDCLSAKSP
ncbi:zinc ABC transporter substrate-binding protein [Vibrio sp. MACH09]|uniref:zinc ABC transporter substrate-binding protein ZnuA n=1 Tax=Vibrio sp. MACH09 TaxID=3025122 RepID=UPI002790B661|nr:zinc ABC transporter substrate-binding protein ZnuA [Vibrio sp. MACH09]GLO61436.1 zinc ABC transporter substrate-binding protein [Vibrio sp. MACH09]